MGMDCRGEGSEWDGYLISKVDSNTAEMTVVLGFETHLDLDVFVKYTIVGMTQFIEPPFNISPMGQWWYRGRTSSPSPTELENKPLPDGFVDERSKPVRESKMLWPAVFSTSEVLGNSGVSFVIVRMVF